MVGGPSDERKISGETERFLRKTLPRIFSRLFPILVILAIFMAVYGFVVTSEEMESNQEAIFFSSR